MEQLNHVDSIWFLKQEDLVDVLEHDFIVMSLAVKLTEIRVKIERVVATRDYHRQVLYRAYDLSCKLSDVSALYDFLVEKFCSCHLIIFAVTFSIFVLFSLFFFIFFLLFFGP